MIQTKIGIPRRPSPHAVAMRKRARWPIPFAIAESGASGCMFSSVDKRLVVSFLPIPRIRGVVRISSRRTWVRIIAPNSSSHDGPSVLFGTSVRRHHRLDQRRGMVGIVIDGVGGGNVVPGESRILPGIEIPVEAGKITARNLQPQHVSLPKDVAG